jgi:hypothetical protein
MNLNLEREFIHCDAGARMRSCEAVQLRTLAVTILILAFVARHRWPGPDAGHTAHTGVA